eukprot:6278344-Prymnesium_polylepis.1
MDGRVDSRGFTRRARPDSAAERAVIDDFAKIILSKDLHFEDNALSETFTSKYEDNAKIRGTDFLVHRDSARTRLPSTPRWHS